MLGELQRLRERDRRMSELLDQAAGLFGGSRTRRCAGRSTYPSSETKTKTAFEGGGGGAAGLHRVAPALALRGRLLAFRWLMVGLA